MKSLTELDIDLIDSNEAMLVLNNLPNVQILNGKSTKDDEDEEEEENGDEDLGEINEMENTEDSNRNNKYNNELSNRLNHLYPKMEEIEEYKNSENNSNYISDSNNKTKTNHTGDNIDINDNNENINITETDNENNYSSSKKRENSNNSREKDKKVTRNKNVLNEKEFNPKIDSNNEQNLSNITSQNKQNTNNSFKKKTFSPERNKNVDINKSKNIEPNSAKIEKERESTYEIINSSSDKISNFLIDITNEELNLIKAQKYNENSNFIPLIKNFYEIINSGKEVNIDDEKIKSNYIDKLKSIEDKKNDIPNYYYFYLLNKKKMKIIHNMYNELISYICEKNPELNKNNILKNLNEELFNTIKESKDMISYLHNHIESYAELSEKKNDTHILNSKDNTNYSEIIKEKDSKISSLELIKEKLLKNLKEDSETYEKKIANLETENKIMTEKILSKANTMLNSTLTLQQATIPDSDKRKNEINITSISKLKTNNNDILTTNITNHLNHTIKNRSPIKLTDNTNTFENINTINYLNTNTNGNILITNGNTERRQVISLKTLKDLINEIYISKEIYDIKCENYKLPKETLEEHMYTFLNKKYGLKNLIIEWAKNIIAGIKYYSKKDSIVLLFGKIMRNEQEENARFIIQKLIESIEELLLYYIKGQYPLKLIDDINKIFQQKKSSYLIEEEWKGIIYTIYEKEEAQEIEKKIENFIDKETEKKKMEMVQNYKNSRLNHQNNMNIITSNNSYYLNTINSVNSLPYNKSVNYINNNINLNNSLNNSYLNTFGNVSNKLSRIEKYNLLYFNEERIILYNNFMKIVLDHHIRFRDKQLKNFVELFKSVDTNRDGIINEDEFSELIQKMKIFKEEEIENIIFQYLEKIDPFDNQKFTFSECINFFSSEYIQDKNVNGEGKEISVLEKVCFQDNTNKNGNNLIINQNENIENDNDKAVEFGIDSNNNINEENENNKEINIDDKN